MVSPLAAARRNPVWEWWRTQAIATVDHRAVVTKVQGEAAWSGRCAFMTLMSAGIAVLGLLLSSPAVVIGAMLISPLMGPIIGLGFGMATSNGRDIRQSAWALVLSTLLAVLFCALIVRLSPLQNVTAEIAARTRPNLFDLMVALFSALAGSYAMIRGREGTIVGVAIATALMPPLAVVGYGLATTNWTVFGGALLLFFTNLMTIALTAAVMARLYGFGSHLSPQHTLFQTIVVFGIFVALAIPLGISLSRIAWETNASRQARDVVASQFGNNARISQLDIAYTTDPIRVTATVLTPKFQGDAESHATQTLQRMLGRPVTVTIEQYRVGTGAQAEAAEIANAKAKAQAQAADQATQRMVEQLALVAGVSPDSVLVDRDNKRAVVTAAVLPGATLAAYRVLEQRVGRQAVGWTVTLVPPAAALGSVSFGDDGMPDAAGKQVIATAAWGAKRLNVPVGVAGPKPHQQVVIDALTAQGIAARTVSGQSGRDTTVQLSWLPPEAAGDGAGD